MLLPEVHYRGEDFPLFFLDCSPKGLNAVVPAAKRRAGREKREPMGRRAGPANGWELYSS